MIKCYTEENKFERSILYSHRTIRTQLSTDIINVSELINVVACILELWVLNDTLHEIARLGKAPTTIPNKQTHKYNQFILVLFIVNFDHFQILRAIGKGSFGKVCI